MLKVILLSILVLSMARCSRLDPCAPAPMGGTSSALPQTFTSVEGRFKIGLPPTEKSPPDAEIPNDNSFKWNIVNRGMFWVSYFDSPTAVEAPGVSEPYLDQIREAVKSQTKGQLEVDSAITLAGHPGHELRFRTKHSVLIERIYLVNKRMYSVRAFVPDDWNCGFDDTMKIIDSFELIEESTSAGTASAR